MDPQSDQPGMTKAPSPLFVGEKYVGNITRNGTAVIERTPSPLFFDDTDVGDAGSRSAPHQPDNPTAYGPGPAAKHGLLASPKSLRTFVSPALSAQEEINPKVSTLTDDDESGAGSQINRDLGTPESQILSDEDLGGFVVAHDSESEASSIASQPRRGKSSGLVSNENKGKTVETPCTKETFPVEKTSPKKKKRPSNMLKELAPFMEDVKKKTREDIKSPLFDTSFVKLTRAQTKALHKAKQDKPISPRKTYNEALLMEEQFKKVRGQKKYYPTEEKPTCNSSRVEGGQRGEAKISSHQKAEVTKVQPRKTSGPKASHAIIEWQAEMARDDWIEWDNRKAQITNLLSIPYYSMSAAARYLQVSTSTTTSAYQTGGKIPEGFNFCMDKGLHVFSPTASVFKDFATFLGTVEEIAGREYGVVKVVVPKQCLQPRNRPSYGSPDQADLKALKTCLTKLVRHKNRSTAAVAYEVVMPGTEDTAAAIWCKQIQDKRTELHEHLRLNGVDVEDVWKEVHLGDDYSENKMILNNRQWASKIYAANIAATSSLRDTLRCGNPGLEAYQGNSFSKSRSAKAGVNKSVFDISGIDGTVFGMRLADVGAYSLNYLHDGAPQIWTIVRPAEHKKLEETLHDFQQPRRIREEVAGIGIPRPKLPPACDSFLRHKPLYVPEETLKTYDINYTKVVQYLGEIIVLFPFAYHQAYNTGANIAESIAYASKRWEIFPVKKLLKACDQGCCPGVIPPNFELDFFSGSQPDQSTSSHDEFDSSTPPSISDLLSNGNSRGSARKHSDKRHRSGHESADWENGDSLFDESGSDYTCASGTGASRRKAKRAKTKNTYRDTVSDDSEVKVLKEKIQQVREETSGFSK